MLFLIPYGSQANSKPIDVLFLSPPEIPLRNFPPIKVFYTLSRLNILIIFLTLFSLYSLEPLILKSAANCKVSFIVRVSHNLSSYILYYYKKKNFLLFIFNIFFLIFIHISCEFCKF